MNLTKILTDMKKTILLFSAVVLFAGLTFGQTPQAQDKSKTTTTTKTEAAPAKDSKDGCDEKTKAKCASSKDAKSGCCAHGKKAESKDTKDSKPADKK
jgi:hypothetical protein